MKRVHRSHCPIALALETVGDKWSLLILRDLLLLGKSRYRELLSSAEGIATNILADRLLRLEQRGLIVKAADPGDRRQFRYAATQKGRDLLPAMFELARWSLEYDPYADPPDAFLGGVRGHRGASVRRRLGPLLRRSMEGGNERGRHRDASRGKNLEP